MDIEKIDYRDNKTISILKDTVAKGATDSEFSMFSEICKATGLNPFKKEIWFIKTNGGVQIMTGINGFYTIANNNPQFDGIETEIVENDKGVIIKAIAKVYRKDRRIPMVAEAYLSEFGKASPVWRSMPRVMLTKCAESLALRKAFPQELNGLYTQEEMPSNYENPVNVTPPKKIIPEVIIPELPDSESGLYRYCFQGVSDAQIAWLKENVFSKIDHAIIADAELTYEFVDKISEYPRLNKYYIKEQINEPV